MKYKKMLLLSFILTFLSPFILPSNGFNFGLPLNWITYHGNEALTASNDFFKWSVIQHSHYNLGTLVVNTFIVYFMLLMLYKGLNQLNADVK